MRSEYQAAQPYVFRIIEAVLQFRQRVRNPPVVPGVLSLICFIEAQKNLIAVNQIIAGCAPQIAELIPQGQDFKLPV